MSAAAQPLTPAEAAQVLDISERALREFLERCDEIEADLLAQCIAAHPASAGAR